MSIDFGAIRRKHDLASVARNFTTLSRSLNGPCPLCGGRDRFYVRRTKSTWGCRQCDRRGDVIDLICQVKQISVRAAIQFLEGLPPLHCEPMELHGDWKGDSFQTTAKKTVSVTTDMLYRPTARAFLTSRGLDFDWCVKYRLGYDPARWRSADKREAPAIVIPHLFSDGVVSAVKYRFLDDNAIGVLRYSFLQGSRSTLFGAHLCRGARTLVAVEGELNCIAVRQATDEDLYDVVSCGSESSTAFLSVLADRYEGVVIWHDTPSKVARTIRRISHRNAKGFCSVDGLDANELVRLDPAAIAHRLREAI